MGTFNEGAVISKLKMKSCRLTIMGLNNEATIVTVGLLRGYWKTTAPSGGKSKDPQIGRKEGSGLTSKLTLTWLRCLNSVRRMLLIKENKQIWSHTCDEGGHPPANQVVEPHRAVVDVSHFADHAVDVQPLQEEPGESAEVEEVQQDGHDGAQKLRQEGRQKWILLAFKGQVADKNTNVLLKKS